MPVSMEGCIGAAGTGALRPPPACPERAPLRLRRVCRPASGVVIGRDAARRGSGEPWRVERARGRRRRNALRRRERVPAADRCDLSERDEAEKGPFRVDRPHGGGGRPLFGVPYRCGRLSLGTVEWLRNDPGLRRRIGRRSSRCRTYGVGDGHGRERTKEGSGLCQDPGADMRKAVAPGRPSLWPVPHHPDRGLFGRCGRRCRRPAHSLAGSVRVSTRTRCAI